MTDIGRMAQFVPARAQRPITQLATQLPVSAYFDEARFKHEQERIFKQSALYVGHRKMVPDVGDWRTLVQENGARVLVHNTQGIELISNVCRHRQALMLGGVARQSEANTHTAGNLRTTGGNIVCPLHRWTYSARGELLGAPHFDTMPCTNLDRFRLRDCHGLLFEGPRDPAQDLATLFGRPEFNFGDYVLDHVQVHQCNYNWKTFVEIYLEDYHVGPFHPGLGHFVTCDDLTWDFAPWHSVQRVGVHQALDNPGSDIYRAWHNRVLDYRQGEAPDFGAIWATYFPTHMIELYPHVLVLSTLHPRGPQDTLNVVEFYYPEEIVAFDREFIEAQRAAYMETAKEDDEIAERMDAGRKALMERGVSETGPYQSPMEDGMRHFHEWYQRLMAETDPHPY